MNAIHRLPLILFLWLGLAPFAAAQSAPIRPDLLTLLPDDFAVCVVMHDLRGNTARWEQSAWLKTFRQSPLGKSYFDAPEVKQIEHWQSEMKKHFGLDWPTLRDDILGDTLIFAYTPGPKAKPDDERGLILLQVRKPERLLQVIDRLNDAQIREGKVKLTTHEYKGQTYHRRVEGNKTQHYIVKDSLAAVAPKEEILKAFLDRRAAPPKDSPWAKRFQRAGADSAFLTMCVNPRMLDAEILRTKKPSDPLPGYWKALDAIFVTASIRDDVDLRIAIQANVDKLPDWAQGAFTRTTPPSELWQRFPERSILTIAARTDFAGLADALKVLMPEKERAKLDPFKDIVPTIGPDWGVCVLPSKDAQQLPHVLFALAVKPAAKGLPLDQTLWVLVESVVQAHNQNNPKTPIRVQSITQEKVEIKYLTNDKLFPPGFQPAFAVKDGYLLVATTPDAIAHFRLHDKKPVEQNDTPILRVSAPELAKLLEHRQDHILASLTEKDAKKNLENVIGLLRLFERMTLSQHGDAGQATWRIRLTPASK